MISDNSGGWNSYNTHLSLIYVQLESRVENVCLVCQYWSCSLTKKGGVFTGDDAEHQVLKLYAKTSHKCFFCVVLTECVRQQ